MAVVGAGRGPIVKEALEAAKRADKKVVQKKSRFELKSSKIFSKVKMFAIEKNPSAVKILQIRNEDEWNGQVTVIHTDMRDWKPEEKLDIIISELLGKNKK